MTTGAPPAVDFREVRKSFTSERSVLEGFTLAVAEQPGEKEPVVHSTKLVLVDKKGIIRKYFDGQDATQHAEILRDIKQLEKE